MIADIRGYAKNPQTMTIMDFHLVYCNESSCDSIFEMFFIIGDCFVIKNIDFICRWHYDAYDEVKKEGQDIEATTHVKFEFIEVFDGPESPKVGNSDEHNYTKREVSG